MPASSFPLPNTSPLAYIPSVGLGTFQVDPKLYPNGSVKDSVLHALKVGYRHFDTALRYGEGQVEREVGEAVREAIKEGIVRREDVWITTKLDNRYHAPEDVERGIDESLKNLGMDYVDLYLMHFSYAYSHTEDFQPVRDSQGRPVIDIPLSRAYPSTWSAMESLIQKGKAKHIGVSNFSTPKLRRLLEFAKIKPAVNQIEVHAHFPQKTLVKFCHENGIHVTAFGPLGCAVIPQITSKESGVSGGPLKDEVIAGVAERLGRSRAQVLLAYLLKRGISVIPKSNNLRRIEENFDCLFELPEEEFGVIDGLMGENGEKGIRAMEVKDYVGFDNFNEEIEEP